jgi:hypothetical protein
MAYCDKIEHFKHWFEKKNKTDKKVYMAINVFRDETLLKIIKSVARQFSFKKSALKR